MREFTKTLIPKSALMQLRALRVRRNRRAIVRAARRGSPVVLRPDNLAEHYYHFLCDLALPLYLLLRAAPSDAAFVVDSTGPFLQRLEWLFPGRVKVTGPRGERPGGPRHVLLGMNPYLTHVTASEVLDFGRHVRSRVAGAEGSRPEKVLLIERRPPDAFFRTAAVQRGGGASRRHIPNHEVLSQALAAVVQPPYQFENVRLEEVSFEKQIQLFAAAALVVGQHGAGLANCVWMSAGGAVLELSNAFEKSHFRNLCQAVGLRHRLYPMTGPHEAVAVDHLLAVVQQEIASLAVGQACAGTDLGLPT